tara:strand:+ start:1082 stop:2353 length:1272 start_codon:yes stop_codon:yes gene_type:complete
MSNKKFQPRNRKVGTKTNRVNVSGKLKTETSKPLVSRQKNKVKSEKFLVEASPPIGDVPDVNNAGNVVICHFTDPGFVTLSIPAASISLHSTHTSDYDGACTTPGDNLPVYCPPGSAPDCNGVCNGPSVLDCNENCYNPLTTPAAFQRDCSGVCYDVSIGAPNVPDCNGVCGGTSYPDCNGICDGQDIIDCAGICGGNAFIDCGGNCNNCQTTVTSSNKAKERRSEISSKLSTSSQKIRSPNSVNSQKSIPANNFQTKIKPKSKTHKNAKKITMKSNLAENDTMRDNHQKAQEMRNAALNRQNQFVKTPQNPTPAPLTQTERRNQQYVKTQGPRLERQPDHLLDKYRKPEHKSTNPNSAKAIASRNVPTGPITDPVERAKILHRPRPKKSNSKRTHRQIASGSQYANRGAVKLTNDRIVKHVV